MASFGTDANELGIAFRTRSSTALLAAQNSGTVAGAMRGSLGRHGPVTTGPQALRATEQSLPPGQLPNPPAGPHQMPNAATAAAAQPVKPESISAALAHGSAHLLPPSLTPSQRGELELAKARAERAAAGRSRGPPGGGGGVGGGAAAAAAAAAAAVASGAHHGAGKRHRGGGGAGAGEVSLPNSDDEDGADHSDGELELARLSPEEQERVLTARLAGGGGGAGNNKDARRLKRLLRNRVSAQQARERKKQYVSSLEEQIREQQNHIGLLEKRLETLESQNEALRNIIMTMRGFAGDPPAGAAVAAAAAAPAQEGGPTGRSPTAAAQQPADARGAAHAAPRRSPQLQPPTGAAAAGGGAAARPVAGPGARPRGSPQPQYLAAEVAAAQAADQVVPELDPNQHHFPGAAQGTEYHPSCHLLPHQHPHPGAAQHEHGRQRQPPEVHPPRVDRMSAPMQDATTAAAAAAAAVPVMAPGAPPPPVPLLPPAASATAPGLPAGPPNREAPPALPLPALDQAPHAHVLPYSAVLHPAALAPAPAPPRPRPQPAVPQLYERSGDGSSPSVGFVAAVAPPQGGGFGAGGPPADRGPTEDDLRYPTPLLGELPPGLLGPPGGHGGMPYDDDVMSHGIEVPDCVF